MKLGLIGRHIQKTRSNELHEYLGQHYNCPVQYDLFDQDFTTPSDLVRFMEQLGREGYQGVNVTQPYKLWAWNLVDQRQLQAVNLGALNTVLLAPDATRFRGTNTDCTGFTHAFRDRFPDQRPGRVLMKGTGGVGRAIAFGLAELGVDHLDLMDTNAESCASLVDDLSAAGVSVSVLAADDEAAAMSAAQGVVNATPLGHYATPGNPFGEAQWSNQIWAFDAVYTPMMTPFMQQADAAGVAIMTGFELFLYQGIDAFEFFTDIKVDPNIAREGVRI